MTTSFRRLGNFLELRAADARAAGVGEVYVDPWDRVRQVGPSPNLNLGAALPRLVATGVPVLVGTSRKSFIGHLAPADPPMAVSVTFRHLGPMTRLEGSLASAVWAMACGAAVVRVHDVAATVQAARLFRRDAA